MAKMEVFYTATWVTEVEIPDDFRGDSEDIFKVIGENEDKFDFQDGGARWQLGAVVLPSGECVIMLND